jgi:cyclophilin family peptidyl-prolyl cis-trans isomerase
VHNDFQHGLTWTLTLSLLINIKGNGSSRIMVNRTHITTQFGDIELEFYSDFAPKTVENFKKLAENRFYDGLIFHRIVPGFVIQGGDPHTRDTSDRGRWGTGGPGWTIKAEFNKNKHSRGAISMARSQDPDSAGSQFFIVLQDSYFLDGQYTVFGRVISGMDIVDKISSLKTDSKDAPIDPDQARMITVTVRD